MRLVARLGIGTLGIVTALLTGAAPARANIGFAQTVNDWCEANTPDAQRPLDESIPTGCAECHLDLNDPKNPSKVTPGFDAYKEGKAATPDDFSYFCPVASQLNDPPVLDPIADQAASEGQSLTIAVTASDPNGDALSFDAANLPQGATFAATASGAELRWTPAPGQAGSYTVTFMVSDDWVPPATDSQDVTITVGAVNRPPVLDPVGDRSGDAGALLSFAVTASDPDGDTLMLAASGLPTGAQFTDQGGGSAQFSWTPSQAQTGNHTVRFTASDDGAPAESDFEEVTLTVGAVNRPPVLDPIGARSVGVGETLALTLTASDPDGDGLFFDAADLPAGAVFTDNGDGSADFSWTPGAGDAGNHTLLFGVTDAGEPPASDSESVVVSVGSGNRPPVLDPIGDRSVEEGGTLSLTLTASDPDGDGLAFSADGLSPNASLADSGQGSAQFVWQTQAGDAGNYDLTFRVSDDGTPPASDSEAITISVGSVNRPPALGPIGSRSLMEGETLVVSLTASDPDGDGVALHVAPMPAGAGFNDFGDGTAELTWTPASGQAGSYALTATATDTGTPPAEDSEGFTVTVRGMDASPMGLHVTQAEWDPRKLKLRVRGEGAAAGALVELLDLESGEMLASRRAKGDGRFHFNLKAPYLPCNVAVASGDLVSQEASVLYRDGGPVGECGAESPVYTRIKKMAWKRKQPGEYHLTLKGDRAPAHAEVKILDDDEGSMVATVPSDERGRFQFREKTDVPPCHVRVTLVVGGQEREVTRGPLSGTEEVCEEEQEE